MTRQDVLAFLHNFKAAMVNGFYLVPRKRNMDDVARLGLTISDVKNVIMGLTPAQYCSGPAADHSGTGDIWVFGTYVEFDLIYIKLKLDAIGPDNIAKCLSFHQAVYPMSFPYN